MICSARNVSVHIYQFLLLCHYTFATFPEWLYNTQRSNTNLPHTAVCYGLHAVFTKTASVVVILLGLPPLSHAASSLFLTPCFPTKFWSPDSHIHLLTCSHPQIIPTCRHTCLLLSQWSFVVHQLTGPFPFSFSSCQHFWPGACYLSFALLPALPFICFIGLPSHA